MKVLSQLKIIIFLTNYVLTFEKISF